MPCQESKMTQKGEASANAKIDPLNCKFCRKEGLTILPLRYGTLSADDLSVLSSAPGLGGPLGAKVTDKAIKQSKYTVRLLRPGYLYTLEERKGVLTWSGYKINARAQLFQFKVEEPAPLTDEAFKCDIRLCAASAAAATILKPEEVPNFYLLYTLDPLSQPKLDEYKQNAAKYAGEGKMRVIHPNAFAPNPSQHTIAPANLSSHVLEYWLFDKEKAGQNIFKAPYAEALKDQLFPPLAYLGNCDSPIPTTPAAFNRLGRLRDILVKDQGAGVVLPDPIGITQELNNFRNDAFTRIDRFLNETDQEGISNQRKLIIYNKIEEVREALASGLVAKYDKRRVFLQEHKQEIAEKRDREIAEAYRNNNVADARHYEMLKESNMLWHDHEIANQIAAGKQAAVEQWRKDYEPRLDRKEMETFMASLKKVKDEAQQAADKRAQDHIAWLNSKELMNAFDTYDKQYPIPQTVDDITPEWLKSRITEGTMRQRHAAALELALIDPNSRLTNTRAKVASE